jgi:hypothetical protein
MQHLKQEAQAMIKHNREAIDKFCDGFVASK